MSRSDSPVNSIARYRGNNLRRPSSAGPSYYDHWSMQPQPFTMNDLQRDPEPLPDVNEAFLNPTWNGVGGQGNSLFVSYNT